MMVASGLFDLVLVVAEEKMSSCQPHPQGAFLTIFDHIIERPLGPNLLWIFSLEQQRYMAAYGIRNEDIALVSVKNKHNALAHPAAQVAARLTVKDILDSDVVARPVHRLMVSPVTDGAAAVVLASEQVARRLSDRPIWIQGVGWCLDTSYWGNRDLAYPRYVEKAAWMAYEMAGVTEPRKQIHVAEPYDPFAYKELHHLEGLQLADRGQAPEDLAHGRFDRTGELPSCPSGGLMGVGNPIAAAGLMKICEVRCRRCGRTVTPPRAFCELDFKPMDEWVELRDTGTINTFSICYVTWDMKPLRVPQIPAVIEIDGTSPRVGFLHLVGGVRGRTVDEIRPQVRGGVPVRAGWKPPAQREGAITDLADFCPGRKRGP